MKIADLKNEHLKEGIFDTVMDRLVDMSKGDGLTGFVRSLMGQNAGVKALADKIETHIIDALRSQTNFNEIKQGKVALPLTIMVKAGVKMAVELTEENKDSLEGKWGVKEADPVSADQIAELIRTDKATLLKVTGNVGSKVLNAIMEVVGGSNATPVPDLKYDEALDGISMALAAAILIVTGGEVTQTSFKINDPSLTGFINDFKVNGEKIVDILLDPKNGLKQNENFVDNVGNLLIAQYLNERISKQYATMTSAKLRSLIAATPELFQENQYRQWLSMHDTSIANSAELVTVIEEVKKAIKAQFVAWLNIASLEAATGRKPQQSMELYNKWAKETVQRLNASNYSNSTLAPGGGGGKIDPLDPLGDPASFTAALQQLRTIQQGDPSKIPPEMLAAIKELNKPVTP